MKRYLKYIFAVSTVLCATISCNWLDINPNNGVGEDVVFGSYRNIKAYFDYCYSSDYKEDNVFLGSALFEDMNTMRYSMDATTDCADAGRTDTRAIKNYKKCFLTWGVVKDKTYSADKKPVAKAMWTSIRIANNTLEHLDGITDCSEDELDELRGFCYFTRAFAHFVLCRRYGGVPYLSHTLGPDDEWDLARPSNWDTYQKCAEDFYTAYQYLEKSGWMRRDALPGQPGHLTSSTAEYPSGVKALAYRARCLVYCASPLSNQKGQKDWEQAAEACAEALKAAEDWQYSLVEFSEYEKLFVNGSMTNEAIWVYNSSFKDNASTNTSGIMAYPQSYSSVASGVCPTQNFVDRYETRWGDPLFTEEDRKYAESIGHYNPKNPYVNLDPRFEATIVHDGSTNQYVDGAINIYKDSKTGLWPSTKISGTTAEFGIEWGSQDGQSRGWSNTGYYCKKYWEGKRGDKGASHSHHDNMFRLAELYLLYAEAVNEAYGPDGKAGECTYTPVDAVNVVRHRVGMPDVQSRFTGDKDTFRERVRNERCIELAFECHNYYYDIRRWMIAPETMKKTLMGMYIYTTDDPSYPKGKVYERRAIPDSRQTTWKDCMYYLPIAKEQAQTMSNFKNNELWQ